MKPDIGKAAFLTKFPDAPWGLITEMAPTAEQSAPQRSDCMKHAPAVQSVDP
jgi:hypothetical protein